MTRRLIITMGASLFYSASWKNAGPFAAITDYERWRDNERLTRPEARREWSHGLASAAEISDEIQQLLTKDPEAAAVVDPFDPALALGVPEQYSAELTTMLAMRRRLDRHNDFASFLRGYSSVVLLHGNATGDPTATAARHLRAALATHLSLGNIETHGLDGSTIQQELEALITYLHGLQDQAADLVATGGYKAFAVALGHIYWERSAAGWRLFYLHESNSGELIQEWREGGRNLVQTTGAPFSYPAEHLR